LDLEELKVSFSVETMGRYPVIFPVKGTIVCEVFEHILSSIEFNDGSNRTSSSKVETFAIRCIHSDNSLNFIHSLTSNSADIRKELLDKLSNSACMLSLDIKFGLLQKLSNSVCMLSLDGKLSLEGRISSVQSVIEKSINENMPHMNVVIIFSQTVQFQSALWRTGGKSKMGKL
jgi:hypothetical protein